MIKILVSSNVAARERNQMRSLDFKMSVLQIHKGSVFVHRAAEHGNCLALQLGHPKINESQVNTNWN